MGDLFDISDQLKTETWRKNFFNKEVHEIVFDLDKLLLSDRVKKSLKEVDPKLIIENLKFSDSYRK
jgi:hypothetical protein